MFKNYLNFYLNAKYPGFSVHSPFLYSFSIDVLKKINKRGDYNIEIIRKQLLKDNREIYVNDLGAGSKKQKNNVRKVLNIARYSLTSPKYCSLIKKTVEFSNSSKVLELGTSLGISSLYFYYAKNKPQITTIEGAENVAIIAKNKFKQKSANVNLIVSDFENFFKSAIKQNLKFDFFFIDGHHTKEATLKYFEYSKEIMLPESTFIFDDIRWSKGMFEAWQTIKKSDFKGATVELPKMGILFFNEKILQNVHVKSII